MHFLCEYASFGSGGADGGPGQIFLMRYIAICAVYMLKEETAEGPPTATAGAAHQSIFVPKCKLHSLMVSAANYVSQSGDHV